MRKYSLIFILLYGLQPAYSQSPGSYTKTERGIRLAVPPADNRPATDLQVEVIQDNIFHVTAQPAGTAVNKTHNLVVPEERFSGSWKVTEAGTELLVGTARATARISRLNGTVHFEDAAGTTLLSERSRSNITFTPDAYGGDSFYRVRQTFNVSADEGLYGLGQHQSGVMNYNTGRQVTLLQYNTMIGIPFLYSTRNYGLLWHNYSITQAGDTRPLLPLSAFRLHSPEGYEGWLTVKYYDKAAPGKVIFSRPESEISYLYLNDQDRLPKEVNLAASVAVYEGKIESPYEGLHRLHFNYSGYLKVWVDGVLREDRWRESWNAGSFETDLEMKKGQKYDLKMEWMPDGGQAYLGLKWQSPIPEDLKNTFSFDSEAGDGVDYYFIAGADGDEVIRGYRELTGKAQVLPRWSFGYWQSRERYKTQQELEDVAKEFRKRRIPIDNMVQDWSYWPEHDWGSHDFDKTRFPDPEGMVKRLHQDNFRLMISVWPKINEESSVYRRFKEKGWLYMRNIYDARKDWIGKGYTSTFYDPFNADARKGFWELMDKKLYKLGIDAWWMDASEPDIHSNTNLEERKAVMQPAIGSSVRYYNAFPLENARGIYEGQRATDPDNRVFILTRSFFAGQQRYAAVAWSGDISSRWHDMKDQISAGVNFSMSGTPYWTMDAGGFLVEKRFHRPDSAHLEEWREMNTRWYQYGAFLPLFRAHGQFPFREPFNIAAEGHPAYSSMTYYIRLRYRLLPYIYSLAGKVHLEDGSMIRGLAMDFPQDKNVFPLNDQFLLGHSLLVNPVTEKGALSRKMYLPAGTAWYDFYSGRREAGGREIEADAPYERIPLYVRAGSIVPLGPELQYTAEKKPAEIWLWVYAGADGAFRLYEDEGTNNNYEKGQYTTLDITYNDQTGELTLGKQQGSFDGMLKERVFRVVRVSPENTVGFDSQKTRFKTITYKGNEMKIKLK
ncbi:TIM-barrel domain-containing protein [Leadbetterella sp. DM7]|uniref:glycoside hydrolase family 31 protein n=1 Tax=Leadbetterella sp. DM7 TaxID=3235085 RepID=UPI00349ED458